MTQTEPRAQHPRTISRQVRGSRTFDYDYQLVEYLPCRAPRVLALAEQQLGDHTCSETNLAGPIRDRQVRDGNVLEKMATEGQSLCGLWHDHQLAELFMRRSHDG